jgi:hypothetical protein
MSDMAIKKTKSKSESRRMNVMTVPMPKAQVPNNGESVIAALAALQASTGWAIVKKILDDNIVYLERAIIEKTDPLTKEALTDKEVEEARYKRNITIELRDTPANYLKQVSETGIEPENFDPYFKTKQEIDATRPKERAGA